MQQINNILNITIGSINVNFVKIAVAGIIISILIPIIKFAINRMKFDKFIVVDVKRESKDLKGHSISVTITNIGNEKLWIEEICILFDNERYIDIECHKCLEPKQRECFEKRYSKSIPPYACFNCVKKYFIFYDKKIYMIEYGKKEKHKIIKLKQYNSCMENKQRIMLSIYKMYITNENKERNEIIFDENMIYLLQFVYRKDIKSNWQFLCLATIDTNGMFISYDDKYLLSKNGEPFNREIIDKHILKYPDKIVGFIRDNWIDTSVNDIGSIKYTTTPVAIVLSGVAERV